MRASFLGSVALCTALLERTTGEQAPPPPPGGEEAGELPTATYTLDPATELNTGDYPLVLGPSAQFGIVNADFTAMAWINRADDNSQQDHPIFANIVGGSANKHLHLVVRNSKFHFGFYYADCSTDAASAPNEWEHVAFVYDKGTDGGTQRVYVNGILRGACTNKQPYVGTTEPLVIGQYLRDRFIGKIREARIFGGAILTQEQVLQFASSKPWITTATSTQTQTTRSTATDTTTTNTENAYLHRRIDALVNGSNADPDAGLAAEIGNLADANQALSTTVGELSTKLAAAERKQADSDLKFSELESKLQTVMGDLATLAAKFGPRPGFALSPETLSSCPSAGGGPVPKPGSEECQPKINADGTGISVEACCGSVTYHSTSCSVDPCSMKRDLAELQSRFGLV